MYRYCMTTRNNEQRLHIDSINYQFQIGIPTDQIAYLVLSRKRIHEIQEANGLEKNAGGHGESFRDLGIIFVDAGRRKLREKTYHRRHRYVIRDKKMTYRDLRRILVHELVHYRWRSLGHGVKFERRINEVLKGKEFPPRLTRFI